MCQAKSQDLTLEEILQKTISAQRKEITELKSQLLTVQTEAAKDAREHFAAVPVFGLRSFLFDNQMKVGFDLSYNRSHFNQANPANRNFSIFQADFFVRLWGTKKPEKLFKFFDYIDIRINGSFSKAKALTLNVEGFGYATDMVDQAGSKLQSYQKYALPNTLDLLLFSQFNAYIGLNIIKIVPDKKNWFFVGDLGFSASFASLDLNAATEQVQNSISLINKKIEDVGTRIKSLAPNASLADKIALQSKLDRLIAVSNSVKEVPVVSSGVNLQPVNLPIIPVFYLAPSITGGVTLCQDKDSPRGYPKRALALQGYIQYQMARGKLNVPNALYDLQSNFLDTAIFPISFLRDSLDIDVTQASVIRDKRNYNADMIILGVRLEAQFGRRFLPFVGIQYGKMVIDKSGKGFFNTPSKDDNFSYNFGLLIDLSGIRKERINEQKQVREFFAPI